MWRRPVALYTTCKMHERYLEASEGGRVLQDDEIHRVWATSTVRLNDARLVYWTAPDDPLAFIVHA